MAISASCTRTNIKRCAPLFPRASAFERCDVMWWELFAFRRVCHSGCTQFRHLCKIIKKMTIKMMMWRSATAHCSFRPFLCVSHLVHLIRINFAGLCKRAWTRAPWNVALFTRFRMHSAEAMITDHVRDPPQCIGALRRSALQCALCYAITRSITITRTEMRPNQFIANVCWRTEAHMHTAVSNWLKWYADADATKRVLSAILCDHCQWINIASVCCTIKFVSRQR